MNASDAISRLRGMFERVRDGQEDLPRASAWVMLDFLDAIERDVVPRFEAEALAEALEEIRDAEEEGPTFMAAATALVPYRSRHPKGAS